MSIKNAQLIERIRNRKGSGEFGYGITTADKYVRHAIETIGNPMLVKHFHCLGSGGVDGLIKRAASTLTICSQETDVEKSASLINETKEKVATSLKEMAKILGCDPPPHAMMAMVNRLTTPREDRDGDTLQTIGANMDPKAALLWQHIHTLPIGKMMRIVEHTKDVLRVATVLLDINELTSDACKLFEAGALRFSHGFIAKEFEERKNSGAGDMARFNILKFDIVEESAVSVPSNVDAEVELFHSGKLSSDVMKSHAKSLSDLRNKSMPVTEKAKKIFATSGGEGPNSKPSSSTSCSDGVIRKMFDVATERLEPSNVEQEWAARFIGCGTKDLHVHTTGAQGMMIGPFLCGLEHATSKYRITDTRNFDATGNCEKPPVYESMETKSDERKTFLVDGIRFGVSGPEKLAWRTWNGWGSQQLLVYADNCDLASKIIADAWEWVSLNNPLKGQAFALAGGWISKTGTAWEDVFLEKEIEDSLKRTVRIINQKGADAANRGLVLAGPPGTGKTLSARVILNEAKATFLWVSAKDFWQLGPYGAFAGAFQLAKSLAPSVICFEDVDNWIDPYTVDLLKGEMDGLQTSTGVTTILTTNFPDQLPAALIDRPGRFHDVLEIHLPTREVRLRMLQKWAAGATLDALDAMAEETKDYSGAHIYELCHFAKVIRDEDECSLEDALTKAFTKVKEQRDLINQNQLSGSSYRPGRRELNSMLAKGWKGQKFNENHDSSNGQFSSGDGGSSSGEGSSGDEHSYGGDHGKHVSVAPSGQVTLTKPKTHEESLAQLKAMEKIVDAAMKDRDNNVPKASLRLHHVTQQLKRAMGFGKKLLASKDVKAQLESLIAKLEKKFGVKADDDPSDEDHELKGAGMNGTKLDSPASDNTMMGPVPNDGESQEVFMERCMLDSVMMDQCPTIPNREAACKIQWGKSATPITKDGDSPETGKCKECGKKAKLDKDGYCADCAKEDKPEDDNPFKGGKPGEIKAGRVLSKQNFAVLEDAHEDMDSLLKIMELPRTAKALGGAAKTKVRSVLDAAKPIEPDPQPSSQDHVLADAIMLVGENRAARDRMRKAIATFDKADANEQLAESVRELESVLMPG